MRLAIPAVFVMLFCGLAPAQVGRIDTVGGTTFDWQFAGPAYRWIVNAPGRGIPVMWMRSQSEQTIFPDLNTGYNYYDYATRRWLGNDTADYMRSGVDVFPSHRRSRLGTLDIDPNDGQTVISGHTGSPLRPELAREVGYGTFTFEYASGSPMLDDFVWPVIAVDTAGWVQASLIHAPTTTLWHSRMRSWGDWDTARFRAVYPTDPGFPCQHVATSRVSHRVALVWSSHQIWYHPVPAFYRESTDGGATWLGQQDLDWPPAYGGDTMPSFHIAGLFPYYDRQDRLHIVAAIQPYLYEQYYYDMAELWHWCRDNTPQWTRIHRASARTPAGSVGYNALAACRPSIGEDRAGGLHVVWEQFDTLNVQTGQRNLLRADIWWARDNYDNGQSWQEPVRLTEPDSTSKRYPVVMDRMNEDTLRVLYLIDSVAGAGMSGEGPITRNPVVVQSVPITVGAVSEPESFRPVSSAPVPTIIRGNLNLQSAVFTLHSSLFLLDISGRRVMELQPGENDVRHLAPGVYFVRAALWERSSDRDFIRKVVIQR